MVGFLCFLVLMEPLLGLLTDASESAGQLVVALGSYSSGLVSE